MQEFLDVTPNLPSSTCGISSGPASIMVWEAEGELSAISKVREPRPAWSREVHPLLA